MKAPVLGYLAAMALTAPLGGFAQGPSYAPHHDVVLADLDSASVTSRIFGGHENDDPTNVAGHYAYTGGGPSRSTTAQPDYATRQPAPDASQRAAVETPRRGSTSN